MTLATMATNSSMDGDGGHNTSDISQSTIAEWRKDVGLFVGQSVDYYIRQFDRLDEAIGFIWSFNWAAALTGSVWMASRRLWVLFWLFLLLEIVAVVQISSGLWAPLGAEEYARAERLTKSAVQRQHDAQIARAAGDTTAQSLAFSASALRSAAEQAKLRGNAIAATRPRVLGVGIILLILLRVGSGFVANRALFQRFGRWRAARLVSSRMNANVILAISLFTVTVYVITAYRFTSGNAPQWLTVFPADSDWRNAAARALDSVINTMTTEGQDFFRGIANVINLILNALETALAGTPWLVTMPIITLIALRRAGLGVAVFTAFALAYLAVMGLWEKSMLTVALLGTAAFICVVIGLPLGIICAKSPRLYNVVRPVLDLMQTMPPFVFLVPAIAFFGIGKPPGILATVIFGVPPLVHLTVLGIHTVPENVREAATAFGASKRDILLKVDLPLALPSIMTGISQTTLMCLSMVVVASLIGAKGLGEDVLNALSNVAPGQGLLAGVAILFCAMILDRLMQGHSRR